MSWSVTYFFKYTLGMSPMSELLGQDMGGLDVEHSWCKEEWKGAQQKAEK